MRLTESSVTLIGSARADSPSGLIFAFPYIACRWVQQGYAIVP